MDWTYLFDNETVFSWVNSLVFFEGHCDIEVVVAEAMRGFLGEDRVSEPNCENDRKTYHITGVLFLCDTSGLQYLRFSPPLTSFFVLPPTLASGLIDPVIDPAWSVAGIAAVVVLVAVIVVVVVIIVEDILDYCTEAIIIVKLPLESFGRL